MLHVSSNPLSMRQLDEVKSSRYELPDGRSVDLGGERCKFTEVMFTGQFDSNLEIPSWANLQGFNGCAEAINLSIMNTDIEVRKELY
jgi:hypothetical protein